MNASRSEYLDRIRQLHREAPIEKGVRRLYSQDFEELAREALETERDTIISLRNEKTINEQAFRRIQRDIDLAEPAPAAIIRILPSPPTLLPRASKISCFAS